MSVAASYFTNIARPYWQWQDEGNVVAWTDNDSTDSGSTGGATIVFRGELLRVFQRMQLVSLPPFGSVVLLMAACRDAWKDETDKLELLAGVLQTGRRNDRLELLNRVFAGLDRVRALPPALRSSPEAKAEIAAMVFDKQTEPPSPGAYELLLQALEHGLGDLSRAKLQKADVVDRLLRDLAWLDQGLARVDAAALAARLKTGVEQPIVPVELEVPVLGSARSLIAELQDDPELGGVARLAKLLLATVNLPRPLTQPEELPLGGVSDISNRGTLDRLLISELANDDQTLSVRVAMNEALYLRREVPPRPPARRRLILLDSGMRLWGVPRLFATAVGLALAAGADTDADVTVLRAAGTMPEEVDFTTSAGLGDHLAVLDAHVHPGDSLAAVQELVDEAAEAIDVVIVTASDVATDRAFQRALAEAEFANVHLAVVDRGGDFALHLQTRRGRKLLKQASYSLDDVFAPTKRPRAKLIDDSREGLPAIFGAQPFPFRLSCPVDVERSWSIKGHGALSYTRDGRLLQWTSSTLGARQVGEGLPEGDLLWGATRLEDGTGLAAVIGTRSRKGLRAVYVSLADDDFRCEIVKLEPEIEQPQHVCVHQGVVFITDALEVNAVDPKTGALLGKHSLAGLTHVYGRFYRAYRRNEVLWKAIAFDGTGITLVDVYQEPSGKPELVSMFDIVYTTGADFEGPCGVLRSGSLFNPATKMVRTVRQQKPFFNTQSVVVSRDGSQACLTNAGGTVVLIDTRSLAVEETHVALPNVLDRPLFAVAKPVVMRHRFLEIGVNRKGELALVGRRDIVWPIEEEFTTGTLRLGTRDANASLRIRYRFESYECPHVPHALSLAEFADRSRAVLDERGLLHLTSSDAELPEVSIVLTEGVGACRLSDGRMAGNSYFLDGKPTLVPRGAELRNLLARFTERLR